MNAACFSTVLRNLQDGLFYSGIYSSWGEFGGFVTLAVVENFIFILAGVNLQTFYSSGSSIAPYF